MTLIACNKNRPIQRKIMNSMKIEFSIFINKLLQKVIKIS